MNELSLFSGAGGGLLGTKLLGFRHIGYVENNDYCQRVLAQRIKDGILDDAPIFGDIRTFLDSGSAGLYRGVADIITAGFPCQPFSLAGKGASENDPRNMWPETIRVVQCVRPSFVLLENVPGLLAKDYIYKIMDDIAEAGYEAFPPIKLGACDIGANHRRKRIWILAYAKSQQDRVVCQPGFQPDFGASSENGNATYPESAGLTWGIGQKRARRAESNGHGKDVSYTDSKGLEEWEGQDTGRTGANGRPIPGGSEWWNSEPGLGRLAHGIPNRVDRLKVAGNGQVPRVVQTVWRLIFNEEPQEHQDPPAMRQVQEG